MRTHPFLNPPAGETGLRAETAGDRMYQYMDPVLRLIDKIVFMLAPHPVARAEPPEKIYGPWTLGGALTPPSFDIPEPPLVPKPRTHYHVSPPTSPGKPPFPADPNVRKTYPGIYRMPVVEFFGRRFFIMPATPGEESGGLIPVPGEPPFKYDPDLMLIPPRRREKDI